MMTVENRVQMIPVAVTAHCCGYEILSAGRLKSASHSVREGKGGVLGSTIACSKV